MSGSGGASLGLEQAILGHTLAIAPVAFPAAVYVGLCSAALSPTETTTGVEIAGGGYTRQPATFAFTSPANVAVNATTVVWPAATAPWGATGYFELWDAPEGGNRLYWGTLASAIDVSAGDVVRFSAGTLSVGAWGTVGTPGVTSFNGRIGPVTLTSGDITSAGGALDPVTATGGTVPRTLADRFATVLTVDDFGAKGDGVTDDSNAFDAYAAYLRAQFLIGRPQLAWTLGFGRKYIVTRSVDCTNFTHFRFEGNHSQIGSADLTHPVLDLLGTDNSTVANLKIFAGTQAAPARVGVVFGVYNDVGGRQTVSLQNIEVDGYFTRACIQNSGSEVASIINCIQTNRYNTGSNSNYALILDGTHHWDLDSRYVTDVRTRDIQASFNAQEVIGGNLYNVGDGGAVWASRVKSHHFRGLDVHVAAAVPAVDLVFLSSYQWCEDLVWDTHTEIGPTATFRISGHANPVITGMVIREGIVQATGSLFMAAAGVSTVRLLGVSFYIPQWLNAAARMFDQPSKYTITGDVTLLAAAFSHWNTPAGGFVRFHTDIRTGFAPGIYGILTDSASADIAAAQVTTPALIATGGTLSGTYAGAHTYSGLLTCSSAGTALTVTNNVSVGGQTATGTLLVTTTGQIGTAAGGTSALFVASAAGSSRSLTFRTANAVRWNVNTTAGAEGGGNTGSDFAIDRYDDSGNYLSTPISVPRFNGQVNIGGAMRVNGNFGVNVAPIAKPTGWGAPTGTATRATFVTGSVTLPQLAEHVKALIDDLTAYGLIGP